MKKQRMTQEEYKKMKLNSNKHYLNSVLYVGGCICSNPSNAYGSTLPRTS